MCIYSFVMVLVVWLVIGQTQYHSYLVKCLHTIIYNWLVLADTNSISYCLWLVMTGQPFGKSWTTTMQQLVSWPVMFKNWSTAMINWNCSWFTETGRMIVTGLPIFQEFSNCRLLCYSSLSTPTHMPNCNNSNQSILISQGWLETTTWQDIESLMHRLYTDLGDW